MRIRRSVFALVFISAALIVLAIYLEWKPPHGTSPILAQSNTAQPNPESAVLERRPPEAQTPVQTNTPAEGVSQGVPQATSKTKSEEIREGLTAMNDVPIAFYGKLEDQFGGPVVGAQVVGNTIVYNGLKAGAEHVSVTTDANGLFQINAGKGESLGIWPRKQGYVLATTRTEFKYSYMYPDHFTPDPKNPVVVKMWKLQGPAPLVGIDREYKLPFTGTQVLFDIVEGKVVSSGGDVEIKITRATGTLSKRLPGKWSIELRAINGGLIESDIQTARITFEAPDGGYKDKYFQEMNPEDRAWYDGIDKEFFLKSRGGASL